MIILGSNGGRVEKRVNVQMENGKSHYATGFYAPPHWDWGLGEMDYLVFFTSESF